MSHKEEIDEIMNQRIDSLKIQRVPDFHAKQAASEVVMCALEAGIMISTAHGQGTHKLMPVSDRDTLEAFARMIRRAALESEEVKGLIEALRECIEISKRDCADRWIGDIVSEPLRRFEELKEKMG